MARSMAEAWEDALEKWMASVPVVELEEITQEEWDYIEDWKWKGDKDYDRSARIKDDGQAGWFQSYLN